MLLWTLQSEPWQIDGCPEDKWVHITSPTSFVDFLLLMTAMDWRCYLFHDADWAMATVVVPACHTLWLPASLKCSVHISSSAWLPSPRRRRLHAAWCPSSGPGCRGKRSGEPHSPTTGTLVKTLQLRTKFLSDKRTISDLHPIWRCFLWELERYTVYIFLYLNHI